MNHQPLESQIVCRIITVFLAFFILSTTLFGQWEKVQTPSHTIIKQVFKSGGTYYAVSNYAAYKSGSNGQTWKEIFSFESGYVFKNIRLRQDTFYFLTANDVILRGYENSPGSVDFHGVPPNIQIADFVLADSVTLITNGQVIQRLNAQMNGWETISTLPHFPSYLNYLQEPVFDFSNGTVWLYGDEGLMRSDDLGVNWEIISDTLNVLSMLFSGDTILCETVQQGTLRSFDNGENWTALGNPYDFNGFYKNGNLLYGNHKVDNSLSKIYVSPDLGETWVEIPFQPTGLFIRDFLADGNLFLGAGENGVLRSGNAGQSWTYANKGLRGILFANVFNLESVGDFVVYRESGTSHFSSNGGQTWQGNLLYNYFGYAELNGNYFTGPPNIFKSTGDVSVWTPVSTNFFQGYEVFSLGNDLGAYSLSGQLLRSQNEGLTWELAGFVPVPGQPLTQHNGNLYYWDNTAIQESADFGSTWQPVSALGLPSGFVLKNMKSYEDKLLVTDTLQGMFLSSDGGENWVKISDGLLPLSSVPGFNFKVTLIGEVGILVVNAANEVFFTPDAGQNWGYFHSGIETFNPINSGTVTKDAFYLGAGEEELWRRDFSTAKLYSASGTVYLDENGNGIQEPTETGLPGFIIELAPSELYTATGLNGNYAIALDVVNDTIRPVLPIIYAEMNPPFYTLNNTAAGLDFGIKLLPGVKDLAVTLTPHAIFRPGFSTLLTLTFTNEGTTIQSGKVELTVDNQLLIENMTPPPAVVNGNMFSWDFTDLLLFEQRNILIEIKTPATATIGAPLAFFSQIDTLADLNTGNNFFELNTIVTGSFDPNDKLVQPAYFTKTQADNGEPLTYTVRFQNTGNYPASFVTVADTLSAHLDPATFRVLAASHPMTWTMEGAGIVNFRFDSINLPDSTTNEPASHGFVKYSIQAKPGVQLGDKIENTAHIYFDFNEPVTTNTTVTTVENPLAVSEAEASGQLLIQPNPAAGRVTISLPHHRQDTGLLWLFSATGQPKLGRPTLSNAETIDLTGLQSGVYIVRWEAGERVFSGRVVVLR